MFTDIIMSLKWLTNTDTGFLFCYMSYMVLTVNHQWAQRGQFDCYKHGHFLSLAAFQGSVTPASPLVTSQTITSPTSHLATMVTTVPIKVEPSQPVYPTATTMASVSSSGWTPSVSPGPATNNSNSSQESDSKDPPSVSPITVSPQSCIYLMYNSSVRWNKMVLNLLNWNVL